jgi:ApbE superfamily uncharacterized protein (UPF0280 family)
MSGATHRLLTDGRVHLQHGPIDVVLRAWGAAQDVAAAYRDVVASFADVLPALCRELPRLRRPVARDDGPFEGMVAERMRRACMPHLPAFITPMAAVAGAVADHLLAAMTQGQSLERAFVNDGGDIAFHLAPGENLRCGLVADILSPALNGVFAFDAADPARGVATSGRATKGQGGRSFSLGIADAVTVLADDAAAADAAATMIANQVDLPDHQAVLRRPACELDADSDLGARLVTVGLAALTRAEIEAALARGAAHAQKLLEAGRIRGAVLVLREEVRVVGIESRRVAA